jgi:hypothetical protein
MNLRAEIYEIVKEFGYDTFSLNEFLEKELYIMFIKWGSYRDLNSDYYKFYEISNMYLSEEFMNEFEKYLNWEKIEKNLIDNEFYENYSLRQGKLSNEFIERHKDKMYKAYMIRGCNLSKELVELI